MGNFGCLGEKVLHAWHVFDFSFKKMELTNELFEL